MDNFLDTESPSIPSDENLFKSTALTEAALMGVYATMTDTYIYGQKLCVNWQGASDVEVGSGAFSTENYNSTLRDEGAGNFYDDNYNRNTRWDKLYYLAESATTIVDGIRRSPLMQSTSDKAAMRRYLGEALALKALGYFELIRYWGDVPYKEHASESGLGNVYIGKVDRDIVYNYIIEDLKEAIEYLPWMGEESYTVERMNKGFAKGLLAKVALFAGGWSVRDGNQFPDLDVEHHPTIPEMNGYFVGRPKNWKDYYELAAKQCAEILGATDNPHELDPSYENIWSTVNHLEYNKYNENLFEVAFGEGQNGDVGATMGYNLNRGVFNTTQGMGGAGYAATTAYYFYSFDPADTRRDVTCVFQEYINENGKNKEVIRCNPLGVACGKWRWYWMTDNYMKVRFPKANSRIATGINWILMRYSDIYLMFAEAQNVLTGPDAVSPIAGMSPRQALEKVRERAFGTAAYPSPPAIFEAYFESDSITLTITMFSFPVATSFTFIQVVPTFTPVTKPFSPTVAISSFSDSYWKSLSSSLSSLNTLKLYFGVICICFAPFTLTVISGSSAYDESFPIFTGTLLFVFVFTDAVP